MADADKQFNIRITIDGVEQAEQAFSKFSKTIGTANSSGLVQNVGSLAKATDAEAKAVSAATDAIRRETEALKANAQAKRESAAVSGPSSTGGDGTPSPLWKAYTDDLLAKAKEKRDLEKSAAEEAAKLLETRKADVEKLKEALPFLKEFGLQGDILEKLYLNGGARAAGPYAAIAATAKVASTAVDDLLKKFEEVDKEGFEKFKKDNLGIMLMARPVETVKEALSEVKEEAGKVWTVLLDNVSGGAVTAFENTRKAKEETARLQEAVKKAKEERRKEEEEFSRSTIEKQLQMETEAANESAAAFSRLQKLQSAQAETRSDQADLADKRALKAGGDAVAIGGNAVLRHAQEEMDELGRSIAAAREHTEELEQKAFNLESKADQLKGRGDVSKQELEAAEKTAHDALIAAQEAARDAMNIEAIGKEKAQQIANRYSEAMDGVQETAVEKIRDKQEDLGKSVSQKVDAVVGQVEDYMKDHVVSATTKNLLGDLKKLRDDGENDAAQADQIFNDLNGIFNDGLVRDKALLGTLDTVKKDIQQRGGDFKTLNYQIEQLTAVMQSYRAQLDANTTAIRNLKAPGNPRPFG